MLTAGPGRHDENREKASSNPGKDQGAARPSRKRLAISPATSDIVKRSAFGDITNAVKVSTSVTAVLKENQAVKVAKCNNKPSRKSLRVQKKQEQKGLQVLKTQSIEETGEKIDAVCSLPTTQRNLIPPPGSLQNRLENLLIDANEEDDTNLTLKSPTSYYEVEVSPRRKELEYLDHDIENISNPSESPVYALAIFEYMRARQCFFPIQKYLSKQSDITPDMRAILVDWMVEVQENFELNHETLYLAVKLVDLYLQNKVSPKDILQLVGATALFVAAKFDERHPPCIDDFMYICDDAYNRKQMLAMERSLLHIVGFDINIPISYRFLRRYAKCSKTNMQTLTLARFVLELSLQCYELVDEKDSLMAASALWLAFKMNKNGEWTETLIYYTSHLEREVLTLARRLNSMVGESKARKLRTIWQKYSHHIFYEVAKIPLLTEQQLNAEEERISKEDTSIISSAAT